MNTERIYGQSLVLTGEPPTEWLLWKFGQVRARWAGGREEAFVFDQDAAESVMRDYADLGHDLPLDYNHAQFDDRPRSERDVRAAGSFELELRSDGLWMTDIRWTEDAETYIRRREYRYLSPTFDVETKSGRIVRLLNVALTPNPATLGALPLVASQAGPDPAGSEEAGSVEATILGLREDAPQSDVLVRAAALHAFEGAVLEAVSADSREAAMGRIEALTAKAAQADALKGDLDRLRQELEDKERETLIRQAVTDRKLTPAQAAEGGFARRVPLDTLKAFLADAPTVLPSETRDGGAPADDETWDSLDGPQKAWLFQHDPDRYVELRRAKLGR